MAIYIEMPKLSDTMTEGVLVKWLKKEGDKVTAGDVLAEVETDKATMEMEAFDDGILHKHLIAAGGKVPVGGKIALLLQKGEAPPAEGAPVPDSPKKAAGKADTIAPAGATEASTEKSAAPSKAPAKGGDRVKVSPLAKKIAASKGRSERGERSGRRCKIHRERLRA
jgi:pyruvate dehydrogenase E2 component (dihydrolipoamide acetyltransferase)